MTENVGITPEYLRSFTTGTLTATSPLPGLKRGDHVRVTYGEHSYDLVVADFRERGRDVQLLVEPAEGQS
jgi:hypothetical protein